MPDARHVRDQHYCSSPECRKASKKASQKRWLESAKGAEYRDPEENKRRVRLWRQSNPGYWRRGGQRDSPALQDTSNPQPVDNEAVTDKLATVALQDTLFSQPALVVGLIAHLSGSALQDTIVEVARHYVSCGQDILDNQSGNNTKGDYSNASMQAHPV